MKTRKQDVVDEYFGDKVIDPYRWLEDGNAAEVKAWTDAQNTRTRKELDVPLRAKLRGRIDELLAIGFVSSAAIRNDKAKKITRYFHVRRDGQQDQPIVYVRDSVAEKDRVLLDPTSFSDDKTSALDWWYPSSDGRFVAYGASVSGDEQSTLRVRDVATGKDLADVIARTRMSSVAWVPDSSAFYYTKEPEPGTVPKDEEHYHRRVYHHVIGKPVTDDTLIFPPKGTDRPMTDIPSVQVTPSGRFLIVRLHQGWAQSSVFILDVKTKDQKPVTVVDGTKAIFDPLAHRDAKGNDLVILRTNDGAPNFRLYSFDTAKPDRKLWREVVPEQPDPIRDFDATGKHLFVGYLTKAHSRIELRDLDGTYRDVVPLHPMSTASVPHGDLDSDEAMFEEQGYTLPPRLLRVKIHPPKKLPKTPGDGPMIPPGQIDMEVFATIDSPLDTDAYAVDQIEAHSKDGATITAFVVHRKNVPRDGTAPALLYGYGGFNISQTPSFNRTVYAFLERGGIYVVANLRGGAEYGEAWHRAGMLESKQNVFDDAIAIANKVVADKWTSPQRLAVMGGSNGGLLVGALVTQHPELFRAAVCAVPLLDMLRYHRFLIAKLWVPEYGSSEDAKQYPWLKAYSPYHHVVDGTRYPAVLFMTAESDSRVDPLHARKMAARMQEANAGDHPVLLRVETKAGHGAGKPRSKQLEELSDQYTFLFQQLGVVF